MATLALHLHAGVVEIRPAPAWVETLDIDTTVAVSKQNVRWGIYDLLADHQVHVGDGGQWQYFRTVRNILSPSGVRNASELELDFDPSFERLVIHHVHIVRGGMRLDALEPDQIRVIEKEDESENRIYDGERTALLFLRDVRPGDVIDYSWSLDGSNPILAGRYTDQYDLSSGVPTRRMRHRLLWQAGRPLRWRGGNPAIVTEGGTQVLTWEKRNVAALDIEDELPGWYEPWHSIEVSEFASWQEVARWSTALFTLDERSQSEVKALAARISADHPTRDARILADRHLATEPVS